MRRLVVGCGYLGERVARVWREAGDEVYATTRGPRADGLSRAGLRPIVMDVTQGSGLDALPEVDTVVFAVGRARPSGAGMFDIHVEGLRAVLDALPGMAGPGYCEQGGVYVCAGHQWSASIDGAVLFRPQDGGCDRAPSLTPPPISPFVMASHRRTSTALAASVDTVFGCRSTPSERTNESEQPCEG